MWLGNPDLRGPCLTPTSPRELPSGGPPLGPVAGRGCRGTSCGSQRRNSFFPEVVFSSLSSNKLFMLLVYSTFSSHSSQSKNHYQNRLTATPLIHCWIKTSVPVSFCLCNSLVPNDSYHFLDQKGLLEVSLLLSLLSPCISFFNP